MPGVLAGVPGSPEEIASADWSRPVVAHPDDDGLLRERWDHSLQSGEPFEMEMRLRGADGIYRWHLNRALPVRDHDGTVTGWVGTATNIDVHKRAELEQEVLAAVGQVTASEIGLQEILDGIVEATLEVLADAAWLFVRREDGTIEPVATAATDPDARRLIEGYTVNPNETEDAAGVFATGRSKLHRTVSEDLLRALSISEDHLEALRAAGLTSVILAPILSRGEVGAVLKLGRYKTWRKYDERDLAFVEEIARRAGLAIDNARLYVEARRSEAELAAHLKRMETLLRVAPVGIGIAHDPKCERITTNDMFAVMLRLPPGANFSRAAQPEERPTFITMRDGVEIPGEELPIQRAAFTGGEIAPEPVDVVFDNGDVVNILGSAAPLFDEEGRVTGAIGAFMDVTELRRIEEELRRANAAKDEFLGLVSHELKTPMTTILGNAQVLMRSGGRLPDEDRQMALGDIAAGAERLHGIIENLLVLARVETGQEVELEPVMVGRIIERCIQEQRRVYPREVRLTDESAQAFVLAQPVYIRQAVVNLLSNAEKYGKAGEPTEVLLRRQDGELRVHVLDRGRGFSEEEAQRIFEPFYRSEGAAKKASGVGIGLTVCKRLIEAQGGRMWAAPREGGGADIGFCLPLADAEPEV
jgi:PAS domain S-box-containing protein